VFVLASLKEPFGTTIIEAMAAGRPVISSDLPGPRESVVEGETGLFFPAGDAGALADHLVSIVCKPVDARCLRHCGTGTCRAPSSTSNAMSRFWIAHCMEAATCGSRRARRAAVMRDYALVLLVLGLVPLILYRAWIGALAWTWIGLMNPHLYTWDLRAFPFAQVIGIAFLAGWVIARDKKMIPTDVGVVFMCLLLLFITLKNPFAWNQGVAWEKWGQYVKVVGGALLIGTVIYTPSNGSDGFSGSCCFRSASSTVCEEGSSRLAPAGTTSCKDRTQLHRRQHAPRRGPADGRFRCSSRSCATRRAGGGGWVRSRGMWLTLLAILFTYSRGAWLGLIVVVGLLFLQSKRKALLLAILIPWNRAGRVDSGQALRAGDTIAEYREDSVGHAAAPGMGRRVNVASRHPLGSGFILDATPVGTWMSYANFHHPAFTRANAAHSIYFQMLGDHGFGGLALFLMVVFGTFLTLARVRSRVRGDPEKAWLGHYATALMIGLAGYCVSGAFVSLAYFDLFYTFVILSGILAREARPADGG
jgi:putative inorganic carbon (hco3(-)) transporter